MVPSRPLVILVAGDPVDSVRLQQGNFADLIRGAVGSSWKGPWLEVDLREGSPLPGLTDIAGALVTGSAASVTERAPWMLRVEGYLRDLVRGRVPTFGICFGDHVLCEGLGGHVAKNPRGREIGTVDVELVAHDALLDATMTSFRANATHLDTIVRLPPGATVIAKTSIDAYAAVRFSEAAWGVQFHPEMNAAAMRGYLEARREILRGEGLDTDALLATVDDAVGGASILRRFAELVSESSG